MNKVVARWAVVLSLLQSFLLPLGFLVRAAVIWRDLSSLRTLKIIVFSVLFHAQANHCFQSSITGHFSFLHRNRKEGSHKTRPGKAGQSME